MAFENSERVSWTEIKASELCPYKALLAWVNDILVYVELNDWEEKCVRDVEAKLLRWRARALLSDKQFEKLEELANRVNG